MIQGDEIIDSQFIAEQVGFLDDCFDNSFILQNTLVAVKEYVTEQSSLYSDSKKNGARKPSTLNKSCASQAFASKSITLSQPVKQNTLNRSLKAWGLPEEIANKYKEKGITEMFEWQVSCLANSKVLLDCSNLVYSAPTSAGKTLVAEILTIKTILERQKKVIVILPFVSIVREKMFYLQEILSSSGIRVEGFMGAQSPPGGLQAVHVAICTIEKANSLINRLLDDGNISDLGAVIVDELHLLGDPHRGYILELLLTKIKYVSSKSDDVLIQVVGMSATLPNLDILANWLSAELFITQFRPIPLEEFCLVDKHFYDKSMKCVSSLEDSELKSPNGFQCPVLNICLNTIKDNCSVLIFCMTKNWCENLAQNLASSFYSLGSLQCESGSILRSQLKSDSIKEVLEQLKNCPVGLDPVLMKTISFGVAYHHAGLTFDERDIIEAGFKSGAIRVLVATSTLSSGVNLPARKVIIRSPVFQRQPINILTYKQMVGRAGRMGRDAKGESILICTEAEKKIGFDLMIGALDPVKSCIDSEDKYMRAVLEMIASQVVCNKAELELYSKCTLLSTQKEDSTSKLMENTLSELLNYELVRLQVDGEAVNYVATPLGKACLSASMAPNDGLSLFLELQKARQCLVLETDLHLIYLVTPYSVSSQWGDIDWLHLLTMWEALTKAMKRVGELVGVQESFIIRCLRGANKMNPAQSKLNVHKRFYTALALQDLVNEVPLSEVAAKFQCSRGFLQSLQQAAATFAGMVTSFCRQLGWKNMEILVSQFQDRLYFGIHSELLDLMKLTTLNGFRARVLFDAGFETLSSVASADANIIENILHKAVPFQSEKEREDEDSDDLKKRKKIKSIYITGYCGMTAKEAAQNLISEARKYLENEIGSDIKWNTNIASQSSSVVDEREINTSQSILDNVKTEIVTQKIINYNETITNEGENLVLQTKCETQRKSVSLLENSCDDINSSDILFKPDENDVPIKKENHDEINEMYHSDTVKENMKSFILPQMKSTPHSDHILPLTVVKDEIVWDSLEITETAIQNISKIKSLGQIFSPDITFSDTDNSTASINVGNPSKCTSAKDVSLFSTDGENSSFFEESLPLELIPSTLLDDKSSSIINKKHETISDFSSINSNSIIDVFKSPLMEKVEDDDDNIKLVYEENDSSDGEGINLSKEIEVACSQNPVSSIKDFKSPYKRPSQSKENTQLVKRKKMNEASEETLNSPYIHKLNVTQSPKCKIEINSSSFNCILLKGNDIYKNLRVMENTKAVSVYLSVQHTVNNNKKIGSSIVNDPTTKTDTNTTHGIKGISFCLSLNTCVFLDLSCMDEKMTLEKTMLKTWLQKNTTLLKTFFLKKCYLDLKKWLDISIPHFCDDVSLAEWLINSEESAESFDRLMKKYTRIDLAKAKITIDGKRKLMKNLDSNYDACIRAWCIWKIASMQECSLHKFQISGNVINIEKHVAVILANGEHHGITVDKELASQMLLDVRKSQEILQQKANQLAGYNINFNSSKCVATVLGMNKTGKVSTKKSVLRCHTSPLASIVIYWRKLHSILTKSLYPLTEKAYHMSSDGNRIHPTYKMYTCTGRISMHEPSLQNVPRTFTIPCAYLENSHQNSTDVLEFNCRRIFKATPGYVMVSADYCQLEMRILTHFSRDVALTSIMRSGIDVFKSIGASWSNLPEDEVHDDLRQKTKQLCYGILYGMGNVTLAQQLDVTEMEAVFFMSSFYKTFPNIQTYKQRVIEECRKNGYVETLMKRRRYLPNITSKNQALKNAAERQAVNTTIQGSAADIAKAAMCAIDNKARAYKPRLLLQMHDELIYEVPENYKDNFMRTMKEAMENTITLTVPLPVKVKCGPSWGCLEEVKRSKHLNRNI